MIGRLCPICLAPIRRARGETLWMLAARRTCGQQSCIERYRGGRSRRAAQHHNPRHREFVRIGEWPPGMAQRQPFADNVRVLPFSPPRLSGPASLAGGCSSSAGWGVA